MKYVDIRLDRSCGIDIRFENGDIHRVDRVGPEHWLRISATPLDFAQPEPVDQYPVDKRDNSG
jgi:hypothetical protein